MTPKEKAQEIFDKYFDEMLSFGFYLHNSQIKRLSLIAVDELICEVYNISHQYTAIYDITTSSYLYTDCKELTYWNNVKQEIEAL